MDDNFDLKIVTPDRNFYSGEVTNLIINTPSGQMEIMRHTLPLVTLTTTGTLRIKENNKWMEAQITSGFIRVGKQSSTLMCMSAEWPHEQNDLFASKIAYDEMTDDEKKDSSLKEYKMAQAQLNIQMAKLKNKDKR